jgi:hypothetical protein
LIGLNRVAIIRRTLQGGNTSFTLLLHGFVCGRWSQFQLG